MATEVELKLYCPPDDLSRVASHALISGAVETGSAGQLANTYFDTPDLSLYHARTAVRVRTTSEGQWQTVKCAGQSFAGLSARPEWETPFTGKFDFSAVDVASVRQLLQSRQAELVPVFATMFQRRTWRVAVSDSVTILVMMDQGNITSGEQSWPISEVELELAQGKPEDLLAFAIALAEDLPLIPLDISKAQRGYQLFQKQQPEPQKAAPSPLSGKMAASAAFDALASQSLLVWQANQIGILTGQNAEFIHQFRVALRRLSSLLKLWEPALPDSYVVRWSGQIKALLGMTDGIRDLEVMRTCILAPITGSGSPEIATGVRLVEQVLNNEMQAAMLKLHGLRHGSPLLCFAQDLRNLDRSGFPDNLSAFAEKQLSRLHHNTALRLTRTLRAPTPENAHRLRIGLKHLRYACEFLAPLFRRSAMEKYIGELATLQDTMGFYHDFHVALARLAQWEHQYAISGSVREAVLTRHGHHAQKALTKGLSLAETLIKRHRPWRDAHDAGNRH